MGIVGEAINFPRGGPAILLPLPLATCPMGFLEHRGLGWFPLGASVFFIKLPPNTLPNPDGET